MVIHLQEAVKDRGKLLTICEAFSHLGGEEMHKCHVYVCETGVRLTHTSGAICAGDVASWTGADVATSSVGAFSSITYTRNSAAFINI